MRPFACTSWREEKGIGLGRPIMIRHEGRHGGVDSCPGGLRPTAVLLREVAIHKRHLWTLRSFLGQPPRKVGAPPLQGATLRKNNTVPLKWGLGQPTGQGHVWSKQSDWRVLRTQEDILLSVR